MQGSPRMAIVRWIGIIVLALISAGRVQAQADPLIQVGFTNLMAGQFNVGYQNVTEYEMPPYSLLYTTGWYGGQSNDPTNWYGPGPEGLWAYQQQHPAPVI